MARPRQEFCHKGHPLSGKNLYITPHLVNGGVHRKCKICSRKSVTKYSKTEKGRKAIARHMQHREACARLGVGAPTELIKMKVLLSQIRKELHERKTSEQGSRR